MPPRLGEASWPCATVEGSPELLDRESVNLLNSILVSTDPPSRGNHVNMLYCTWSHSQTPFSASSAEINSVALVTNAALIG